MFSYAITQLVVITMENNIGELFFSNPLLSLLLLILPLQLRRLSLSISATAGGKGKRDAFSR